MTTYAIQNRPQLYGELNRMLGLVHDTRDPGTAIDTAVDALIARDPTGNNEKFGLCNILGISTSSSAPTIKTTVRAAFDVTPSGSSFTVDPVTGAERTWVAGLREALGVNPGMAALTVLQLGVTRLS